MASISISASLPGAFCHFAHKITHREKLQATPPCSLSTKQTATHVVTLNVEGQKVFDVAQKQESSTLQADQPETDAQTSVPKFTDERWKNGTWDLNMFVKDGRMDWDGVIVAEAKRRRFLELFPEACTEQEPVLFRSSIIPWWAWLQRSYLPQAELLNGRAAMVGFFMSYFVDTLTGLDVVGQTGNFICKAGLFVTVISIVLFRRTQDFNNLRELADEAIAYDRQRQASWQDQNGIAGSSDKTRN